VARPCLGLWVKLGVARVADDEILEGTGLVTTALIVRHRFNSSPPAPRVTRRCRTGPVATIGSSALMGEPAIPEGGPAHRVNSANPAALASRFLPTSVRRAKFAHLRAGAGHSRSHQARVRQDNSTTAAAIACSSHRPPARPAKSATTVANVSQSKSQDVRPAQCATGVANVPRSKRQDVRPERCATGAGYACASNRRRESLCRRRGQSDHHRRLHGDRHSHYRMARSPTGCPVSRPSAVNNNIA
jgi:hypothetical protein